MTSMRECGIIPVFCGRGGIGIRARLRGVWETVRVQVPSTAPKKSLKVSMLSGFFFIDMNTPGLAMLNLPDKLLAQSREALSIVM